jgi:tetratricopeptide (TPR) repeat protein
MVQESPALRTGVAVFAAVALLGGCAATRPIEQPAAPGHPPVQPQSSAPLLPAPTPPVGTPPPARENHLSAATRSLVTQAKTLMAHGDLDGASSTLDRALRIEPSNPLLWIELGRLRLAESDAHQAEGCGRKALALASGDRSTRAQAGQLLADALRAQRRNQEAIEVEHETAVH